MSLNISHTEVLTFQFFPLVSITVSLPLPLKAKEWAWTEQQFYYYRVLVSVSVAILICFMCWLCSFAFLFLLFFLVPIKWQCEMCLLLNLWHRSIRCLRNIIHWNLITTFILRNVMWFLLQLIDHNIHESNEVKPHQAIHFDVRWTHCGPADTFSQQLVLTCNFEPFFFYPQPWCRLITTIYNYFVVTNFFWMFVEGCYLHTAIVMTYSTDKLRKWVFLFIGWCEYVGHASRSISFHSGQMVHSFWQRRHETVNIRV